MGGQYSTNAINAQCKHYSDDVNNTLTTNCDPRENFLSVPPEKQKCPLFQCFVRCQEKSPESKTVGPRSQSHRIPMCTMFLISDGIVSLAVTLPDPPLITIYMNTLYTQIFSAMDFIATNAAIFHLPPITWDNIDKLNVREAKWY